jgi:hypothetical protein
MTSLAFARLRDYRQPFVERLANRGGGGCDCGRRVSRRRSSANESPGADEPKGGELRRNK